MNLKVTFVSNLIYLTYLTDKKVLINKKRKITKLF